MTYTVKRCLNDFVVEHLKPQGSDTTRAQFAIDHLIDFFGADRDVQTIKRKDIRAYRAKRLKDGVVDSTIRRELSVLKSAMEFAAEEEKIENVPIFKLPPDGAARERWLSEDEAKRLMELEMPPVVRLCFYIAFGTGARRGAILDLTVGRVDLAEGYIDFRNPQKRVTKKVRVKTKISEWLKPIMAKACEGKGKDDLVVDASAAYISAKVKALYRQIGIDENGIGIHAIRRTFTTWALLSGATTASVSAATGDRIETLEKHYFKIRPEHTAGATNAIKSPTGENA